MQRPRRVACKLLLVMSAQMAHIHRHVSRKRTTGSAELIYLLVVLVAGVATAWWAGHRLGMDLSSISTVAAVLGINETTGTTRPVGYSATDQSAKAQPPPNCAADQPPPFAGNLAALKQQLGDTMGTPVECAHASASVSDLIQQTTTGLAEYNQLTDTASFTDGWRHWALTPRGFLSWEGTQSDPPAG